MNRPLPPPPTRDGNAAKERERDNANQKKEKAMFDLETALAGIQYKLKRVLDDNAALKANALQHQAGTEELNEKIKKLKEENENLKKEIDIIKLRNTLAEKGDATEIKLEINRMIRNIDRGLDLLNKVE